MSDRRFFETGETVPGVLPDVERLISRLRRPGGGGMAVNRYPGPWEYEVDAWADPFNSGWVDTLPWESLCRPIRKDPQLRDANLGWGMWWQTARLPYTPVNTATIGLRVIELDYKSRFADMPGLWVPLYEGDPERRVWRRRKWWGRGPIIFAPHGMRWAVIAGTMWRNLRTGGLVDLSSREGLR